MSYIILNSAKMARGNQRETDRERARKRNEDNKKKNEKSDFVQKKEE